MRADTFSIGAMISRVSGGTTDGGPRVSSVETFTSESAATFPALPNALDGLARIDAAIDVRPRPLRQRVGRVPGVQRRRHAGRAQHAVPRRTSVTLAAAAASVGSATSFVIAAPSLAADDAGHAREVGARRVVELDREVVVLDARSAPAR